MDEWRHNLLGCNFFIIITSFLNTPSPRHAECELEIQQMDIGKIFYEFQVEIKHLYVCLWHKNFLSSIISFKKVSRSTRFNQSMPSK